MHLHKEALALPLFENACQGCLKSISLKIKTSFGGTKLISSVKWLNESGSGMVVAITGEI